MSTHTEHSEHPDDLLPWFVNDSLGPGERQQVESHLAQCQRCRREVDWLQSLRTQVKSDAAQAPTELGLQRLLREVRVQKRRPREWWRPALAAAVVLIVAQFAIIVKTYNPQTDIVPLSGPTASGVVVQIKFAPDASERQIRSLLQKVHAEMIAGPSALGIYRVRLEKLDNGQQQRFQQRIAELAGQQDIVTYVEKE